MDVRRSIWVAHLLKRRVIVSRVVPISQRDWCQGDFVSAYVKAVTLDVKLTRSVSAGARGSIRRQAQSLKQIIRRPILLDHHNNVLKPRDPRLRW